MVVKKIVGHKTSKGSKTLPAQVRAFPYYDINHLSLSDLSFFYFYGRGRFVRKMDSRKSIFFLSLALAILIILVSYFGIWIPGTYTRETWNWQTQSLGQDLVDLWVVVPFLLICAVLVIRGSSNAALLWAGAVMYLVYTFVIYCFDLHFNRLFLLYCFTLGMAFYSLLYFFYTRVRVPVITIRPSVRKTIGIYFIFLALAFYFLWFSEIAPSILQNTVPQSLVTIGLVTNPVHVIDISVFLPGVFMTGIMLLINKTFGNLLAPILLSFFILMDISIGGLVIIMQQRGLEANIWVAIIMAVLAIFNAVLLFLSLYPHKAKTNLN